MQAVKVVAVMKTVSPPVASWMRVFIPAGTRISAANLKPLWLQKPWKEPSQVWSRLTCVIWSPVQGQFSRTGPPLQALDHPGHRCLTYWLRQGRTGINFSLKFTVSHALLRLFLVRFVHVHSFQVESSTCVWSIARRPPDVPSLSRVDWVTLTEALHSSWPACHTGLFVTWFPCVISGAGQVDDYSWDTFAQYFSRSLNSFPRITVCGELCAMVMEARSRPFSLSRCLVSGGRIAQALSVHDELWIWAKPGSFLWVCLFLPLLEISAFIPC